MVCTRSFPTQPVKFWDDPSGEKYFKAYFERFDNVWTHGDFISQHPKTGQVFLHGRADGVLNPSGVRFGSAEIVRMADGQERDLTNVNTMLMSNQLEMPTYLSQTYADHLFFTFSTMPSIITSKMKSRTVSALVKGDHKIWTKV